MPLSARSKAVVVLLFCIAAQVLGLPLAKASEVDGEQTSQMATAECCVPECVQPGSLSVDGPVTVSDEQPVLGSVVTFTAFATDEPGLYKVCDNKCDSHEEPDGPALEYRWVLKGPGGFVDKGSGKTHSVLLDRCGTWAIDFWAKANRRCLKKEVYAGHKEVQTHAAPLLNELRTMLGSKALCLVIAFGPSINLTRMTDALDALDAMQDVPCTPDCVRSPRPGGGTIEGRCARTDGAFTTMLLCTNPQGNLNFFLPSNEAGCRGPGASLTTVLFHELLHVGFGDSDEGKVCAALKCCASEFYDTLSGACEDFPCP